MDFADFAVFTARWLGTNSSFFCGGPPAANRIIAGVARTDFTNDGNVDSNDLKEFAENYLASVDN